MLGRHALSALLVAVLALGSCGERNSAPLEAAEPLAPAPDSPEPREVVPKATAQPVGFDQPVVWPASSVVFTTPEQAAGNFVSRALGIQPPALGDFRAGDSLSGEIDVLFLGEGRRTPFVNSTLLLRQLGPDNGWFVIAGVSEFASITSPEAGAVFAAGPVGVSGMARGFEGTVVVSAFPAGDSEVVLDREITRGGTMADTEHYAVTLDRSDATPCESHALIVRADTGAADNTGEFSVIPIRIAARLPALR